MAMVETQGGDVRVLEQPDQLSKARWTGTVRATRSGFVSSIDTFALGDLAVSIGAERRSKEQRIDPGVGLLFHVRVGDEVAAGAALADLHLAREDRDVVARLAACVRIDDAKAAPLPRVLEAID